MRMWIFIFNYVYSPHSSIDRIPMQLHNATASIHAELHFPEGVNVPFALSKMVLITLPGKIKFKYSESVAHCLVLQLQPAMKWLLLSIYQPFLKEH